MTAENKKTISVCMIVKDEAELIQDAIMSVVGWVDEILSSRKPDGRASSSHQIA